VLSDTHKRGDLQQEAIEALKREGANYLLHLGDLEIEENLKALKDSQLPYRAVFGNNDYNLRDLANRYYIKSEPYYLKIGDIKIKMMHHPYFMTPDVDIVLFGHLHKFSVEYLNGTLFLNSGEITAREKDLTESALIEVKKDYYIVKYLFKRPTEKEYNFKVFQFKRGQGE